MVPDTGLAQEKELQETLSSIMDQMRAANTHFCSLLSFERYFASIDEQTFLTTYHTTRESIIVDYQEIGLSEAEVEALREFCENFDHCAVKRKDYNDEFVLREQEKYAAFFDKLEAYPLSADQTEAIIRDEDNNLVLAGAGTGKTTTISGKVAYLLEKGLARPEELLIISFTNNAAREMQERCAKFCAHLPKAARLDVRTFNSFGFLVCRSCSGQEIRVGFDDHDQAKKFLQEKFNELFKDDPSFNRKATNYLAFFTAPKRRNPISLRKTIFTIMSRNLKISALTAGSTRAGRKCISPISFACSISIMNTKSIILWNLRTGIQPSVFTNLTFI